MGYFNDSFQINYDLAPLMHMIKVMSLKLSDKAKQRVAWMDSYRECGNAARVCRHFSISLSTFWRWRKRYDPWNLKSLEERSRKPRSSPRKTHIIVERRVLAIKKEHPRWWKEKIALILHRENVHLSGKTVWKILKRHEQIIRYRTRKRKAPKPRVDWAKIRLPGDLLQLDTKHISQHGRKVYQYTLIDVKSRVRWADIYRHADMKTTIAFLQTALPKFSNIVKMVQTDNGSEFGQSVSKWLKTNKIQHVFSHKNRPTENMYVERSHRTDEEEFYSITNLGYTLDDLRKRFADYLDMYNNKRPHWGLGGKTPAEALASYSL